MAELESDEVPQRMYMDDPDIKWRTVKPNYDLANLKYLREKTRSHKAGSLEKLVENVVKTWEMESTHKVEPKDWGTIDLSVYKFSSNGQAPHDIHSNILNGNYNMMLVDSPIFDVTKETNESSHSLFKTAFPDGFAWELLDLLSGPPKISFTWRHWAHWTGPFGDQQPTGELMELVGSAVAVVNDDLKITDLQVFFDPHPMLGKMMGHHPSACPLSDNWKKKPKAE